jgi:DNA-binding response OmpR family regulator
MAQPSKITILNVDDNEAGRYAVSRILKQAGFEVLEAASGEEALRLVDRNPDLIILDVKLPDIDGFEVCRRIKSNPATSLIPILHLSATYQDSESRVKGLEGGADSYLTHPIEPLVLIASIRALLRIREGEAEREKLIRELQEALTKVKTLSGFLPICMSCKKIRNDKGYWEQVEVYIRDHCEAEFSHGICPDCMKKIYPDEV